MLGQMLIYLPGIMLPRLAAFIVLLAATHLLTTEAVGLLALVVLVGEICEGIFLNWLRIALLRHGAAGGIDRQVRWWSLPCLMAALVLAAGLTPFLAGAQGSAFFAAVVSYMLAISALKFGLARLQRAGRQFWYAGIETGRAVLMVPGALIVMQLTGNGVTTSLILSALAAVAGALAVGASGSPKGEEHSAPVQLAGMAAPLIGLAALNLIMVSADRLVLGINGATAALGIYAASYALGRQGFDILTNAAHAGGFPALVKAEAGGTLHTRLAQQAVLVLAPLLCLFTALVLARAELAEALLPQNYRTEAAVLIPIIAAGALALNIKTGLTDSVLLLAGQHWRQMMGLGVGAGVAMVSAALLVPTMGGLGAALGFASGALACLLISWWQARQVLSLAVTASMVRTIALPSLMVAGIWAGVTLWTEAAEMRLAMLGVLAGPAMLWSLSRHVSKEVAHG